MIKEISSFYNDIHIEKLRVSRPSKVVFLCGGVISTAKPSHFLSLRDYVHWSLEGRGLIHGSVILAEKANQIYRDTSYHDLISFEEDIAKIASIILVIAESPGSLAELGAFASNQYIRPKLRLILKQEYATAESFIRFGPVQRIKVDNDGFVGFYPWRTNKAGNLILRSASPHKKELLKFINGHIAAAHRSDSMSTDDVALKFFIIYWIVYISYAITFQSIVDIINLIDMSWSDKEIRNIMFCFQLVGWVRIESYSGKDYFYTPFDKDPFDYAFNDGVADTDSARRKADIASAIKRNSPIPTHVKAVVATSRVPR